MNNPIKLKQIDTDELVELILDTTNSLSGQQAVTDAINASGQLLLSMINSDITQDFVYHLPSGVGEQYIAYPVSYPSGLSPTVVATLINNSNDPILYHNLSGVNPSGFYISLSNDTMSNRYAVGVLAHL